MRQKTPKNLKDSEQSGPLVNQHKRMAMGENIQGSSKLPGKKEKKK